MWQRCLGLDLEVPDSFGHWFAGFTDGEGYFSISADSRSQGIFCRFGIKLRADDLAVLEMIRDTLGVGRINHASSLSLNKQGEKANDCKRYAIDRIGDMIHVIIPLFERYPLRAKKQRDFVIWAKAARLIHAKMHSTPEGHEEILRLKQELEEGKKYKDT